MLPPRSGPSIKPTLKHPEDNRHRELLEGAKPLLEEDGVLEIEGVMQEQRRESPLNGIAQAIDEPTGYEFVIN